MLLAHLSFVAYVLFVSRITMMNLILSLSESWKTHVFIHVLCDGILILITYVFTHDRLVILQRISKLSRVISRREFDDMAKFIHTKDIVVMLYYGLQLLCFAAMSELHSLRQFFIIYVSCATIQGAMFYINCVYFLGGCFKKVDDILRHLNEPLPPHRLELLRTFQSLLNEQDASMIIKLKRCEKLHEEISDVVELLNKSYRVPLNIITVFTFYTITFNLYFFIQSFESDEEGYLINGLYHLLTLLYVVYELTKYSVIIWVCETATNHANQVATTIDNVHANCTDSTARHELKCFTLQVAHRDVQFSANTFVMNAKLLSQVRRSCLCPGKGVAIVDPLNLKELFLGLLGQIVIYVMILFQFLFGINCDGKRSS
ncbi:uncharacterized protein LOC144467661 [Augochlora pura]